MTDNQIQQLFFEAMVFKIMALIGLGCIIGVVIVTGLRILINRRKALKEIRINISTREHEINLIAHIIWETEGCHDGRERQHWEAAERIWEEQHKKVG